MRLIRLLLVPLLLLALSAQSMAGLSMLGCEQMPEVAGPHAQHGMTQAEGSACDDTQRKAHQHGSSLCAFCVLCPSGAALNTSLLAETAFQRLLPVANVVSALFSVVPDLADKPPKAFLV